MRSVEEDETECCRVGGVVSVVNLDDDDALVALAFHITCFVFRSEKSGPGRVTL